MKKAILCAVALIFGAFVYAQDIPGSPTSLLEPPILGSAVGANTGNSIQNGDHNKVRVRQAGTSQSVRTNQNNGSGSGGNLAKIRQTGAVQTASGVENAADVLQSGSNNQAQTRQEGDYNNAVTRQGQNNIGSARNKAKIRQGTGQNAEHNRAAIDQDGDDNLAQTKQTYDNSDAWTTQFGNANKSMIVQNAGPNATSGHEARNIQVGNSNESSIDQSGAGARNTALAIQWGDNNQAKQKQITDALSGATGNAADIQQGKLFDFAGPPASAASSLFNLGGEAASELGSFIFAYSGPPGPPGPPAFYSSNAVAFQTQGGNDNAASITQMGAGTASGHNYAEQEQVAGSTGNKAAILQGYRGSGDNNYAKQYQAGSDNEAGLVQSGNSNKGYQDQRGSGNDVLSAQNGSEHLLNVHQRGIDNRALSVQYGIDNTILLVQRGGQSYTAQQNAAGGYFGTNGGNQIDVLQLGPSGNFATDGIDCSFDPELDPTMNYSIPDFELEDVCPDC